MPGRVIRYGKETNIKPTIELIARIVKHVRKSKRKFRGTPCWEWQRHKDENGYGQIKVNGKVMWVHRVTYVVFKQRLRHKDIVDHLCHNSSCCNPEHLRRTNHSGNAKNVSRQLHCDRSTGDGEDDIPF